MKTKYHKLTNKELLMLYNVIQRGYRDIIKQIDTWNCIDKKTIKELKKTIVFTKKIGFDIIYDRININLQKKRQVK